MNLSEFGLAPPIPGSWWLHAALHASWPWHTALGADETSNEIEWRFHILPYSSIFIHILPSHLHDELLCTKFCQSLLALLRDSEVMFSSRVERIQNIQMPNQECKLGSVLHSQLEVVKEEPSTGQNCFGMQIWTGRARDSEGMWLLMTSLNLSSLYTADKC